MCQRVQMSRLREPKFVYVGYKGMVLSSRQMGFVVLFVQLATEPPITVVVCPVYSSHARA